MTTFNGSAGDDSFAGAAANDIAHGNDGNDTLEGWAGNDQLDGGAGADLLVGGIGDDVIYSHTADEDSLGGYYLYKSTDTFAEKDTLLGGVGNDTLVAGLGDDVDGGAGNNYLHVSFLASTSGVYADFSTLWNSPSLTIMGGTYQNIHEVNSIEGSNYDDFLKGVEGLGRIYGRGGDDHIVMTYATGEVYGGEGNDLIDATLNAYGSPQYGEAGNDTLIGGYGYDRMYGGEGSDELFGNRGFDQLFGDDGDDLLNGGDWEDTLYGGNGQDTLYGGSAADGLDGGDGEDLLFGDDTFGSNDTLHGGAGADTLDGGGGDDSLYSDGESDTALAQDSLNGGDGNDSFWVGMGDSVEGGNGTDTLNISLAADSGPQNLDLSAVQSGQQFNVGSGVVSNVENIGTVSGSSSDDSIELGATWVRSTAYGGDGNDTLVLLGSSAKIYGEYGNDSLAGGAFNDTINGGWGTDTADYSRASGTVNVSLLVSAAQNTVGAGFDTLVSIENLWGSEFADNLTGSQSANVLVGGAGSDALYGLADNDTLEGGAGADTLVGGLGNDTFILSDPDDVIEEGLNEGTDEVRFGGASGTVILSANIENAVLLGSASISAQGNELANRITGNAGAGTLFGMEGNDTLVAGIGDDELRGGAGNDTYVVSDLNDRIVEAADEGVDEIQSAVNWTLTAGTENLLLTGTAALSGTGNALNNLIRGNGAANLLRGGDGADTLDGGAGADDLRGNSGDDTYWVDQLGDKVFETAGAGTDTVQSTVSWTLGNDLEQLVLIGSAAINGTGNALDNTITGNDAANVLDGAGGNDTLQGGRGNDTYIVGSPGDSVVESAAAGWDTVLSSVSWVLGADLEKLELTGTAAINGTGNGLNNQLVGNSNNNLLDGAGGADTMTGGSGNDTYTVDHVGDRVVEAASGGYDIVNSSVTWTLSAEIENLVLTGSAAINATGNSSANRLTGNSASNVLSGGEGADTLAGGLGNDRYVVDSSLDVLSEVSGGGVDTVESTVSWTLGTSFENLTLKGTASASAKGNALNNYLIGNTAANVIDGAWGADTMQGGGGADTFMVDNAGDVVIAGNAFYDDGSTIMSSVSWDLQLVRHLVLTGTSAINGTGSEYDDSITGNSASNTLKGEAGSDTLTGGAGDDIYFSDYFDTVVEQAGGGTDTVIYSDSSRLTLAGNVENVKLVGQADSVIGNSLNNLITGNPDTLQNWLDGGAGADTLIGGPGIDSYYVDNVGDTIIDQGGIAGKDIVYSSISWKLGEGMGTLMLGDGSATNATGNDLDNDIGGNSNANLLDGGRGADFMAGGYGNDIYIVDNALDEVVEWAGFGIDKVQSSVTWALPDEVEDLTLTGTAAVNATGNRLANTLVGNSAANVLSGMLGADRLTGGAGADTFALNDLLSSDTITDFTSGSDKLRISQSSIRIGDGDTLVEGARWQDGAGGFSTSAELVIVAHDISGAITSASAAASIGSASSAYATGQTRLFMVDNGAQSALYLFKAANADAVVSASELTLLATLQGTSSTAVGDVIFSA